MLGHFNAPVLKLPKSLLHVPPFSMAKTPPPPFPFLYPPPLPFISNYKWSLNTLVNGSALGHHYRPIILCIESRQYWTLTKHKVSIYFKQYINVLLQRLRQKRHVMLTRHWAAQVSLVSKVLITFQL